ncbi:MAG: SPOR domain-containing protein [Rhodocyclales bacterium]|nr:SPOR domain-containing protein [Rhodocyclales bacterium]
MRLLIALLLLVNALLLAMSAGLLPRPAPEAVRATAEQPLRPDRLRILAAAAGHDVAAPLPPTVPANPPASEPPASDNAAPDSASAAEPAPTAAEPPPPKPTAAAPPAPLSCLRLAEVDPKLLPALKELPQGLPGVQIQERTSEKPTSWRVVLPPQGSAAAANRRLENLRQAGVDDAFVIRDPGPLQWGISLGLFRAQESAEKRMAELRDKNVKGAQVVTRTTPVAELVYRCPSSVADDLRQRIQTRFPQLPVDACSP